MKGLIGLHPGGAGGGMVNVRIKSHFGTSLSVTIYNIA